MWEDPIVAELHRIREAQAAQFDYDINAMVNALRLRQGSSGHHVVSFAKQELSEPVALPRHQ